MRPEWSPDGKRIAFWSARTGNRDIYSMNADGSGVSRLTSNAASDREPTWSPDGQRIAFESGRDGNEEIYVMDRLGSGANGAVNLTKDLSDDREPAWSPDGKKIAFVSSRDGDDEIFVMDADGKNVQQLTKNDVPDRRPAWQPLGGVEVFPSAAGARGLTTTQVAVAVTGGTVVATGLTVLICGGGNLIPILGQGFFIACGLAISVIVEGGTTIALISEQRKSFRVPSAARASPASAAVIAVPHAFAAPAPTSDACKSLRSQAGCERLKGAIREYQDAVALVAAMSEGAATTALRYAAAGGSAANQALQRAAAKVYWGQLDLTTRRERAAAQALADVLRAEGVNVTLSAAQSQQIVADLGQLRGVPSSVVTRLRAGGLTTSQIESGISTAAANLPSGDLDLQSFLRRPIATGAYKTAYRTLSIDEVGYIIDSFRRQGIVSSRLASALAGRLKAARAARSVSQRRQLMRAFVADVRKGLTSEPYSSFLQSAAYPAAGAA